MLEMVCHPPLNTFEDSKGPENLCWKQLEAHGETHGKENSTSNSEAEHDIIRVTGFDMYVNLKGWIFSLQRLQVIFTHQHPLQP